MTDGELGELAMRAAEALAARGWRLATAESCTGGWVAKVCTDFAGSSGWFERGFVTYSNDAKLELLGVHGETLAGYGAVSEETVREMAQGALVRSRADVSLAISGIAGPAGGSPEKPVGTVCFAWAVRGSGISTQQVRFEGDRDAVRRQAVARALRGLLDVLPRG